MHSRDADGNNQDVIEGPLVNNDENPASSDLAGAILYGELVGPLPWTSYSFAANSIYDNNARFTSSSSRRTRH